MATAKAGGFEKNFIADARNNGKPTTDILDKIKETNARKGIMRKVRVTREIAWDILILNKNNRPVKLPTVKWMVSEMLEGRWRYTIESKIGIDWNGVLQDGQHRLLAIFQSGKSQLMDIETGLDPEDFKVLNQGRNRTPGDTVALLGVKNPNIFAAAVNFTVALTEHKKVLAGAKSRIVNYEQLVEWTRDEKNKRRMEECVRTASEYYRLNPMVGHTVYAGMLYVLGTYRRADAEEFIARLATGESISKTEKSSIWYCRTLLQNWKKKMKDKDFGEKMSLEKKITYIIVAWNHYIAGEEITSPLRLPREKGIPTINRK